MTTRAFRQVDVFTAVPLLGNPLAVVLDASGLPDTSLRAFARWTNLSETTFVLPPTLPGADYAVRILTPDTELMFAGHPTLGTCAALLASGTVRPRSDGTVVQECGVGLVTIRVVQVQQQPAGLIGRFAFRAPAVRCCAPVPRLPVLAAVGLPETTRAPSEPQVVNIGIAWLLAELPSHKDLLLCRVDAAHLGNLCRSYGGFGLTVFAAASSDDACGGCDIELRTFLLEHEKAIEDPVCGSANACLAHFLQLVPDLRQRYLGGGSKTSFVARQGSALKREGRIYVMFEGGDGDQVLPTPWIAGDVTGVVEGSLMV